MGCSNLKDAVMRTKLRMVTTWLRGDTQRRFAPRHTLLQGVSNDDDVIDLCFD